MILFFQYKIESYVYFLRVRKVPIVQLPPAQCFLPPLYAEDDAAEKNAGRAAKALDASRSSDGAGAGAGNFYILFHY